MIPFRNRFHGHSSLRFVYKNGQIVRSRFATLKSIANPTRKNHRVAVVVSKKIMKSAVGRNRIRRRVYDYVHNQLPRISGNYDIAVIVTSSELFSMPHEALADQMEQLFSSAGLYK